MEEVREGVRDYFKETVEEIKKLVRKGGEHMLLCAMDPEITLIVAEEIERYARDSNMEVIFVGSATQKDTNPSGKVFFIRIDPPMPTSYQSLVYYYLDITRECLCSLVLMSDSCLSLDGLERRVRSRFNHRIFFFEFLPLEVYADLRNRLIGETNMDEIGKQHRILPTISSLNREITMKKYGITEYSMEMLYAILSPTHIALIIMITKKRIRYISCVEEFKMFTTNVNEFKRISSTEVSFYFLDLIDSGIVDKEGEILIDPLSFRKYVAANRPLYLRNLMYKNM